jgi:hypothetical protein
MMIVAIRPRCFTTMNRKLLYTSRASAFLVAALLTRTAASSGDAGSGQSHVGIVYGKGHAFAVTAPPGWVLDNQSGVSAGLYVVFYPEGSSWKNARAAMYANTTRRQAGTSLESFIAEDWQRFKENGADVKVFAAPPEATADNKEAQIRYFSGDKWDNREAVAYIEEDEVFVVLALTSRTPESFNMALPAFRQLVKSYKFLTKAVDIR